MTVHSLCVACDVGNIQTVRDIVSSKEVDINGTDYYGDTPLMRATLRDKTEVVRFLLTQSDLRLDKKDGGGFTALHMACYNNSKITVLRLLCQDRRCTPSVVNIKNNHGETALMRAVYFGQLE